MAHEAHSEPERRLSAVKPLPLLGVEAATGNSSAASLEADRRAVGPLSPEPADTRQAGTDQQLLTLFVRGGYRRQESHCGRPEKRQCRAVAPHLPFGLPTRGWRHGTNSKVKIGLTGSCILAVL